jgi:hypothetical protein
MVNNIKQKLQCFLGHHKLIWYSDFDKNLYGLRSKINKTNLVTGPLLECKYCDYHVRCENTDASNILEIKNENSKDFILTERDKELILSEYQGILTYCKTKLDEENPQEAYETIRRTLLALQCPTFQRLLTRIEISLRIKPKN